jgi:hypothetical protein
MGIGEVFLFWQHLPAQKLAKILNFKPELRTRDQTSIQFQMLTQEMDGLKIGADFSSEQQNPCPRNLPPC